MEGNQPAVGCEVRVIVALSGNAAPNRILCEQPWRVARMLCPSHRQSIDPPGIAKRHCQGLCEPGFRNACTDHEDR